jgi:hypothetical protein
MSSSPTLVIQNAPPGVSVKHVVLLVLLALVAGAITYLALVWYCRVPRSDVAVKIFKFFQLSPPPCEKR